MKTVLIGNGFNIQFGGVAYSNDFIMKRIKYRSLLGGYQDLFDGTLDNTAIENLLKSFVTVANEIRDSLYDSYANDADTQDALTDFKKRYKHPVEEPHNIMLEDWFFIIHMFLLKNDDIQDKIAIKQGFERLILDGIFNDGKIQELHAKIPKTAKRFFSQYDNIFTLNYDNNLESCVKKTVYHLHGDYSVLANSENTKNVEGWIRSQRNQIVTIDGLEHCFCNALLNFSGKLKYEQAKKWHTLIEQSKQFNYLYNNDSEWSKKLNELREIKPFEYEMIMTKIEKPDLNAATEYYFDLFESIVGELHIIGMSPDNDAHIFNCVVSNKKISKVVFYYFLDEHKEYIENNFDKAIFKCEPVKKLWKDLDCENKKYNCTYSFPNDINKWIEIFNSFSRDNVTKESIIKNVSSIPQFEAIRLGKLVIQDVKRRNPHNTTTTQDEFLKSLNSVCYIALQEGILPSALFMLVIMNFDKIK